MPLLPQEKYTDEELEWIKTRPNYSESEALSIFPEAKPIVLRELKARLSSLIQHNANWQKLFLSFCPLNESEKIFYHLCNEETEREIEQIQKRLRLLTYKIEKDNGGGITAEMVQKAKSVPLSNLLEVKNGFALCPFHTERTPSFKIYTDQNKGYCFSCNGKSKDAIDVLMKQKEIGFAESVKMLCQL